MSIAVITDEVAGRHQVPLRHPERPARYPAVMNAVSRVLPELALTPAPKASTQMLERVHTTQYIDSIFDATKSGSLVQLDPDTWAGDASLEAALRGAGAACLGVDMVLEGSVQCAFSAMRPPGHHAEPDKAMGFCLFSNAAIAAEHARAQYGLSRVAVLDFDVHHGNGTQAAFWDKQGLIYASTHQVPFYPGTGDASERGAHNNIFNHPLAEGDDGATFLAAWTDHLLPAVQAESPELIIISAGFDAHKRDPLGGLAVDVASFGTLTLEIMELAQQRSGGRIVSLLEGGYDLESLTDSSANHLHCLAFGKAVS